MILYRQDADKLVELLRMHAPVRTGNLQEHGIQGLQPTAKGYIIQVGYPSDTQGDPATEDYAIFTEVRNRSSKGWIMRCCQMWKQMMEPELTIRKEGSVDQDEL